ncbi:MAG: polyhydroxybutyrate depolymerase [Candidatus Dormibacteraeota bacterium]|nr:polyhydroxybutyrate depolymerase [Candidatus Dormibacteraeota bacterium]
MGRQRPRLDAPRTRSLRTVVIGVIALLVSACGAAQGSIAKVPALQTGSMTVDGFVRYYRVYTPTGLPAQPVPLLVVLHGGQQYGDAMEQLTGFDSLAEADNFVVAYPNGHGQTWNAGNCCGFPNVSTDNEIDFINALITRVSAGRRVDQSRVYVTGFSAGAAMTHTVGCRLANRVAAIASVAGTLDTALCHPQQPISVLEIHGTADLELMYGGGGIGGLGAPLPAIPDMMAAWASLDGCSAQPSNQTNGSVQTMKWMGCGDGASVVLDTVESGSHNWYEPALGGSDGALDTTQTVWQFLSSHHH